MYERSVLEGYGNEIVGRFRRNAVALGVELYTELLGIHDYAQVTKRLEVIIIERHGIISPGLGKSRHLDRRPQRSVYMDLLKWRMPSVAAYNIWDLSAA